MSTKQKCFWLEAEAIFAHCEQSPFLLVNLTTSLLFPFFLFSAAGKLKEVLLDRRVHFLLP